MVALLPFGFNYLINNADDGTIKTTLHASDCAMTEKVMNNEVFKVNTHRRKMLHKKKENHQEQLDQIIEGNAQRIREMRKKRDQSMEEPSQEINDGQPSFCLLYTSRCV